jgi:hypothetical protein
MKIVAQDKTNEVSVSEVRAALSARQETEAKLRAEHQAASKLADELALEANDAAAAIYVARAAGSEATELEGLRKSAADKSAATEIAKREADALARAVEVAASQTADAARKVVRTEHKAQINRCNRLIEKRLSTALKAEEAIGVLVEHWRRLCELTEQVVQAFPGGLPPPLPCLSISGGLWQAFEVELYRQSARLNDLQFAETRSASRLPGARCYDPANQDPSRLRSLSDQLVDDHKHLTGIMAGLIHSRTGQAIPIALEASIQTGLALKDGRPAACDEVPLVQPTLEQKLAAAASGVPRGAELRDGKIVNPADASPAGK